MHDDAEGGEGAPSIVPCLPDSPSGGVTLETLDALSVEQLASLVLLIANGRNTHEVFRKPPDVAPQLPALRELIRLASVGAKCINDASCGGAAKRNCSMDEDKAICAEFVRRLRSPTRGRGVTPTNIMRDIAVDRLRSLTKAHDDPARKTTVHSKSGVHAAIKRECKRGGKIGLHNTGQCKLRVCHCSIVEETRRT